MPDYNVHFFMIKRPVHPTAGTTGPAAGGGAAPSPYAQFLQRYRAILQDLFERSVPRIPGNNAANTLGYQVHIREIPQGRGPGIPNFTGYAIQNYEPIIYLSSSNPSSNPGPDRRASMTMIDAIQTGRFQNIPAQNLSQFRQGLQRRPPFQEAGMACIPWDSTQPTDDIRYAPVVPEVFTTLSPMSAPNLFANMTVSEMGRNWVEVVANFLAKASFHEVAHCKAESYNRPNGAHYASVLSGSIHNQTGVTLLGASVAWNASASADDFRVMGNYMLCPMPFYKLDQPISPQCTNRGAPRPLVAAPPPPRISTDPLDGI